MITVECKACPAQKAFYSRHNADGWMFSHYRSEHGEFPGNFILADLFVINGREDERTFGDAKAFITKKVDNARRNTQLMKEV